MAGIEFNPDQGGAPSPNMPDQTRASRGSEADRSGGLALQGVGAAIQGGVDAYNDYNHWQIDTAVRKGNDDLTKPYMDAIPNDLSNSADTLKSLQNAFDQGKLSDVYYTGQLTALSKSLRSKYPQYEDYIDHSFQSITGIRPANAYMNAVQNEFAKDQAARNQETQSKDSWLKSNEQYIGQVAPDYFQNPEKYNFDNVRSSVVALKANDQLLQHQALETQYLFDQKKLTKETAGENASQALNQRINTVMGGLSAGMGLDGNDLFAKIQQFTEHGGTAEEQAQLLTQLGQMKANTLLQLQQTMSGALDPSKSDGQSYSSIVGTDQTKALIEQAMAPITAIEQYATDGNWGMVGYYARLTKNQSDEDFNRVLNSSDDLRLANAFGQIDHNLATVFLTQSGKQAGIFAQAAPELTSRTVQGQDTFSAAVSRMADSRADAATKAGGINAMISNNAASITSGHLTPEQFKNVVDGTYGVDKTGKNIFSYIKSDEYEGLFHSMYSPDITQAILGTKDTGMIQTYYNSIIENASSMPTVANAASVLQNAQDWLRGTNIQFVPGVNRLVVSTDSSARQKAVPGGATGFHSQQMFEQNATKNAVSAVQSINGIFDTLDPILTQMGETDDQKQEVYKSMISNMSVSLGGPKKQGLFDWLNQGMSNLVDNTGKAIQSAMNDTAASTYQPKPSDGNYDFNTGNDLNPIDVIKGFEGFKGQAYEDTGSQRVGYGSDTVTRPDGTIEKVTANTAVTQDEANADIERRVNEEFIPNIKSQVGEDVWSGLGKGTQAALASIAYNYGSLPKSLATAVKSGDTETIRHAILNLVSDNAGINAKRRVDESRLVD